MGRYLTKLRDRAIRVVLSENKAMDKGGGWDDGCECGLEERWGSCRGWWGGDELRYDGEIQVKFRSYGKGKAWVREFGKGLMESEGLFLE